MTRLIFSRGAERDLSIVRDRSTARWGPAQTRSYLRQLTAALRHAAKNPLHCSPADDVLPGYRKVRYKAHTALFIIVDGGSLVIRIVHAQSDMSNLQGSLDD